MMPGKSPLMNKKPPSISKRLQFLFDYIYPSKGTPYSTQYVADQISSTDITITKKQINDILNDKTQYPTFQTIAALGKFFNIPLEFFATDDYEKWENYVIWVKKTRSDLDNTSLLAARTNYFLTKMQERQRRKQNNS